MRAGIIGFGKMGMLHAAILNGLKDVEVVAVAENTDFLRKSLEEVKPGIRTFTNYTEMLDTEKPDFVFITTPVHLHVPMMEECTRRRIPFFVEKPMCVSSDQSENLVRMLEKDPVPNMVGYMMRYLSTFRKARELVVSGLIGNPVSFTSVMYVSQLFKPGKGWRYDKEKSGGGVMMGPGCHIIDLIHWYFGNVTGVNAATIRKYSAETEDFAHIMFSMESGVKGWFDISWSVRGYRLPYSRFEIHGDDGLIIVDDDSIKINLDKEKNGYPSGWTIVQKPELHEGVEFDVGGAQYSAQDIDFIRCVKDERIADSNVFTGHYVQKIIKALYRSAENRGNFQEVQ